MALQLETAKRLAHLSPWECTLHLTGRLHWHRVPRIISLPQQKKPARGPVEAALPDALSHMPSAMLFGAGDVGADLSCAHRMALCY